MNAPTLAGSASYTNPVFTDIGAGLDIWDTHDQFHYIYQPLTGDGTIIARVKSQTNTHASAKAGIMIKESTTAFAPYALVAMTPTNGTKFQWNFNFKSQTGPTLTLPNVWLKLQRQGNLFTAYTSPDGSVWTKLGASQTITMNSIATVGLAVTSHNSTALSTATYDNVTITKP